MRIRLRVLAALAPAVIAGCHPEGPTMIRVVDPTPATATSTPVPVNGTVRLLAATLPAGSTVPVARMHDFGQQAPDLRFQAGITLDRNLSWTIVQAWVRTAGARCLGGGGTYAFTAGVERIVEPLSLSNTGHDPPVCPLPFTTTQVEFVVLDPETGTPAMSQSIPAIYHFVTAP